MRNGIHPAYHRVLYLDSSTSEEWVGFSTQTSKEMKAVDGDELPVIRLDISAKSHPFWTGQARTLDTEGRIDRFTRRYGRRKAVVEKVAAEKVAADKVAADDQVAADKVAE